jgi:hypothetical protein
VNKVLTLHLNDTVSFSILSSVGNWFQARGLATKNAHSPSLSLVRGIMTSLLLAERFEDLPGIEEVVVIMSLR